MNLEKYDSSLKCLDGVMYNYKIYTCLHSSIILHEAWGRGISYPFPMRAGVETWGGSNVGNGKLGAVLEFMLG